MKEDTRAHVIEPSWLALAVLVIWSPVILARWLLLPREWRGQRHDR